MLMNDLKELRLFTLLCETSQEIPNEVMKSAYENFVEQIVPNQSETEYSVVFRRLNLTRIEFKTLQTEILYEQGKKCA